MIIAKIVSFIVLSLITMIFLILGLMSLWVCLWDQFRSLKLMTAGYFTGIAILISIMGMMVK